MSMDLSEFFQMFFEESLELLAEVETTLLNIDIQNCSDEEINIIFRGMHSIKGGSATFGFSDISEFTHTLETYLDYVRNKTLSLSPESVDLLLKSVDAIRGLISKHQGHGTQDITITIELKEKFEQYNQLDKQQEQPVETKINIEITDTESLGCYIYFKPNSSIMKRGNDPLRILNEIRKLGSYYVVCNFEEVPLWNDIDFELSYMSWDIYVETDKSEEELKSEIFDWVIGDCLLLIKKISQRIKSKDDLLNYLPLVDAEKQALIQANPTEQVSAPNESVLPSLEKNDMEKNTKPETTKAAPANVEHDAEEQNHAPTKEEAPQTSSSAKKASVVPHKDSPSIRVSTEKVDEIINIVGELVITQAILRQVIGNKVSLAEDVKLKECLSQFSQNIRELQERAMVMRMLPISNVFNRFPRMVRDIAQSLNKKIELKIVGENTELDKTVMEKIGDPLVHLVRNSIDHGIEETQVRIERHKPEVGTLELHAYHQGSAIIIDIIDDGNGLNTKKIKEKALEKGLINEEQNLTDDEIHSLIFLPGFSTADKVTDISGRGVGMDVVKKNIQAVGGSISVYSVPGKGSRFSIKLPLTLSIIDGQILTVSDQTFIFPISSIVEIIQIRLQQVSKVAEDNEVYYLRSRYIPMIHLTEIFDLECRNNSLEGKFLVIVEVSHSYYGIVIDELLGQQQIVIKSIEQNFQHVEGIAGATVLGDGTVALIIDVTGLVQLSIHKKHSYH